MEVTQAGHRMNERPPLSHVGREPRAPGDVVFGYAAPVKAGPLRHQADMGKADEWKRLKRGVPSFVALLVRDVHHLRVGNSAVDVSTGKESVELCRHWNGAQK